MCNQRERLIAYIYDECDTTERNLVQQHLDSCAECRVEIAGLRSVREDLLAWDVPAHESVWRPFAPVAAKQWWRQVPAWAMATAAAVVMLSGAAGGAVLHAFWPEAVAVRSDVAPVSTTASTQVQSTAVSADPSASQQDLIAKLRDQLRIVDAQIQKVSTRSQALRGVEGDHGQLTDAVISLRQENSKLAKFVDSVATDFDSWKRTADTKLMFLQVTVNNLQGLIAQLVQPSK